VSARHSPNVVINMEVTIIHPHRMPAANRNLDQPLPQPWNSKDALGYYLSEVRHAEITGWLQQQDSRELLRYLASLHRQKRQIG
jgi:hypothetical protein